MATDSLSSCFWSFHRVCDCRHLWWICSSFCKGSTRVASWKWTRCRGDPGSNLTPINAWGLWTFRVHEDASLWAGIALFDVLVVTINSSFGAGTANQWSLRGKGGCNTWEFLCLIEHYYSFGKHEFLEWCNSKDDSHGLNPKPSVILIWEDSANFFQLLSFATTRLQGFKP